jgi:selenocysteine lyase/cysteine desulfurase
MLYRPSYDLDAVRRQVPLLATHVPMNACSQAPQSEPARRAAEAYLDSWRRDGMDWERWIGEVEAARSEFAALIGADPADVAVAGSVSQATASVATGLDFTGRRYGVVVSGVEFPTVAHVWRAQERLGAEVRTVPTRPDGTIPIEDYAEAIDETTLVVSAAHAFYLNGWKQDLHALASLTRERGALLYVDAYQSLGTEPFHAPSSGADFVTSGNLKFLMGMPGIAFVWVRPSLSGELRPAITGWFGRKHPFAFDTRLDWAEGARRLDTGTPPVLEAYVARAGMAWLRELGLDHVAAWVRTLGANLVEGARVRSLPLLGPEDSRARAPTTAFACESSDRVEAALRTRGILASARGPAVRLAPHFYNTLADVDTALDALAEVLGTLERV